MNFKSILFFLNLLVCLLLSAQEKQELKPYTIETTYEKLKKDYPFINPVTPLASNKINAQENLVYKTIEERELKADIYIPNNGESREYPAVLMIHGGGWLTGSKENQRVMAQHLAMNGYTAVTAAYRLGTEAEYPAGVLDLKDAIKWIRENAKEFKIDKNKIAVLGASAGAQLATLLGVTPDSEIYDTGNNEISDEVQAIINVDGIVSFIHPEAEEGWMAATWFGGSKAEKLESWKEASPLEYVDSQTPPTLFINSSYPRFHAGRDDMTKILSKNNIYYEIHTLENSPHSFWLMHPWFERTLGLSLNFLNKVFKNASSAKEAYREITVAQDGSGDFSTIQEAINSTRDLGPGEVKIYIKNGTYNEKLEIPSWKHQLTLLGESKENTIITNDDYSGKLNPRTGKEFSTFTSYTVLVRGDDIKIENLTIKNFSCDQGQAVALHVEGDRFVIKNSNILGCQDTLYTATAGSRQLYLDCYIEGTTDFIFGEATAVFKNCIIKSLKNSYVTAAATPQDQEFGYVFINCKLTAAENVYEVYLGRPWRPYAKTVFLNTEMGSHIVPKGWNPWKGDEMFPNKEETTFYAEYNSNGAGASSPTRVEWSHQLNEEEVRQYTLENIFSNSNDWYWASKALD
ncbi:pectinesterase family protein [Gramella sp. MAR_2010_147]|uniref:pectinesterase family protein n=1 Tax=Gramella sp. MAR_2010_147 TaxID=1250205 RepID=UPI00087BDAA8|nr:pectinesterase family protein [Gramella sp. MAR_2010_147]SDS65913.1 Pectin methylesterase [Gramella sp. MAR_2010_147]